MHRGEGRRLERKRCLVIVETGKLVARSSGYEREVFIKLEENVEENVAG